MGEKKPQTEGSSTFSIVIEKLPKKRIRATVSVENEKRKSAEMKALRNATQDLKIKGFRPGKAPEDMLRAQVGPELLLEHTIRELVPEMLRAIYEKQTIDPIIVPKIDVKTADPLSVDITFTENPDVSVKEKNLKVEKKDHKVDQKDVDRIIKQLLKEHATETTVDRAALDGDTVIADFYGEDGDKKEIPGTKLTAFHITIGSKNLIPGFEEGLIGIKKDETRTLNLTFPEKYHAEHLKGKPVTFHVTAKEIKEVKQPEMTREFLKEKLGTDKSPEELRKEVEGSLIAQEERMERERRENEFFSSVHDATSIDIAEELLEAEMQSLIRDIQKQIAEQSQTLDEWLKTTGKTWDEMQKDIKQNAEKRIKTRFGVKKLMEQKEIKVSDEEVMAKVEEEMTYIPREEQDAIKERYQPGQSGFEQLKWELEIKKLLDIFLQ